MQYSTAFLALFAATGALAAPFRGADNYIRVILQNQATETGSQTRLQSGFRDTKPPVASTGPYTTIELKVGAQVANRDKYRCAIYDENNKLITATRGANVDTTFSDAGKGEWTFKSASIVSSIVCDPTFVAAPQAGAPAAPQPGAPTGAPPKGGSVRVILQDQQTETGSQTVFADSTVRLQLPPTGSSGPFETVEIRVDATVDPKFRCQVLDKNDKPIVAVRGANTDTTFSDADKGAWTFKNRAEVKSIICDPTFVAKPL